MTRSALLSIYIAVFVAILPIGLITYTNTIGLLSGSLGISNALSVMPLVLLSITAFLAWRMDQLSVFFSALFFLIAYFLIKNPLEVVASSQKWHAIAVAAPITMIFLFSLGTKQFGRRNRIGLFISFVLPMGLLLVSIKYQVLGSALSFKMTQIAGWHLSDWSLILCQIYALTLFRVEDKDIKSFCITTVICLIPFFWLLNDFVATSRVLYPTLKSALIFCGLGVALLYSMYRVYWQKIYIDELTELPNRRALESSMNKLGRMYTIVMVDIDYFKKFNDTFGHDQGDTVLRFVAFHLSRESEGRAFRYGGEEFCLLFEGVSADRVFDKVDHIRKSLYEKDFVIRAPKHVRRHTSKRQRDENAGGAPTVHVSISGGLASPENTQMSPEQVRSAADQALYRSKNGGRNKMTLWLGDDVEEYRQVRASS